MFKSFLYIACLLLVISSCSTPYVVRDYEFAPPNCDCYIHKHAPRLVVSSYSKWVVSYKRKVHCNKQNYLAIQDSLYLLETQRDSLRGYSWNDNLDPYWEEPADTTLLTRADSLVNIYKSQWVSCKIKLFYRKVSHGKDDPVVTVRRKITFYRRGLFRYKKIRKVKYVNDRIIRSRDK